MTRRHSKLATTAAMMFIAAGALVPGAKGAEPAQPPAPAPYERPMLPPPAAEPPPEPTRPGAAPNLIGSATVPAGEASIRRWFDELAHANSSVREQARVALMGIKPEELGVLRRVVDAARPVSPAQAAVLHDVVIHVYAGAGSDRPNAFYPRGGFLGVLLEPVQSGFGMGVPPPEDVADFGAFASGGVMIKETWPGFAGFRFLRVGDVVVGTGGANGAAAAAGQPTRAPTMSELKAAVTATAPGLSLDLQVLRQGRVVDVPVRVSARPAWAEDEFSTRQMHSRRLRRAEVYWRFAFAPLLWNEDGMS